MDISGRLKQLEDIVAEAKSMPLSSSVLVSREEILGVLESIREGLPEEIKQARWVVKDREELLVKARQSAEGIVQEALVEQGRLASQQEVVQRAQREADSILGDARDEARQIKLEAEDWIDAQLAAFEGAIQKVQEDLARTVEDVGGMQERLSKVSQQIRVGRQRLRGGTIAENRFTEEPAATGPEEG